MEFVNNWQFIQNSSIDQFVIKLAKFNNEHISEKDHLSKNIQKAVLINHLKSNINASRSEVGKLYAKKSLLYETKIKKNAILSLSVKNLKSSNSAYLTNEEIKDILLKITFYLSLTHHMIESSEVSSVYDIIFKEDDFEILITSNYFSITFKPSCKNNFSNYCNQSSRALPVKCISHFLWNLLKGFAYLSINYKIIKILENFKILYILILLSPHLPTTSAQNTNYPTHSFSNATKLANYESPQFLQSFQQLAHIVLQKFQGFHFPTTNFDHHLLPKRTFNQGIKSGPTMPTFNGETKYYRNLCEECTYLYFALSISIFALAIIFYFHDLDAFRVTFILYFMRILHHNLMRCLRLSLAFGDALIFRPFSPSTEVPIFYRFALKHRVHQRATRMSSRTQSNAESESEINSDCEFDYATTQPADDQEILDPLEMATFIKRLYLLSYPSIFMSATQNDYSEPDVQTLLKWVGAPLNIFKYDPRLSLDEQFHMLHPANDFYKNGANTIRITPKRDTTLWKVSKPKVDKKAACDDKYCRRLSSFNLNQKPCADIGTQNQEFDASPMIKSICDSSGSKNAPKAETPNNHMPNKFIGHEVFEEETSPTCSICLEAYEEEDMLWRLPSCRHTYHRQCIYSWVCKNPTCPICRSCIYVDYYYA